MFVKQVVSRYFSKICSIRLPIIRFHNLWVHYWPNLSFRHFDIWYCDFDKFKYQNCLFITEFTLNISDQEILQCKIKNGEFPLCMRAMTQTQVMYVDHKMMNVCKWHLHNFIFSCEQENSTGQEYSFIYY